MQTIINSIFNKLDKLDLFDKHFLLGVSGGPDSIFLFYIIQKYFETNNIDFKQLHIAHYNHNTRKECFIEGEQLKITFKDYNFYLGLYQGKNYTENFLRKARYDFFDEIISKNNDKFILLLGHNLTDRIETTFLNLIRGCSKKGFLNMSFYEKSYDKTIVRPLIEIPKETIQYYCDKLGLYYFKDSTNDDISFSKRNLIRHNIISKLIDLSDFDKNGIKIFYKSMQNIYNEIDNKNIDFKLQSINICHLWEVKKAYLIENWQQNVDCMIAIFEKIGIYKNISQGNLFEMFDFIINSDKGYKYFNGYNIIKAHGKIYLIKGKDSFWKKSIVARKKIINIGIIKIEGFEINIEDTALLGGEIGFYDSFEQDIKNKLQKKMIKNKIPIFWRKFVPIIVKEKKILKIFNYEIL